MHTILEQLEAQLIYASNLNLKLLQKSLQLDV